MSNVFCRKFYTGEFQRERFFKRENGKMQKKNSELRKIIMLSGSRVLPEFQF